MRSLRVERIKTVEVVITSQLIEVWRVNESKWSRRAYIFELRHFERTHCPVSL